MAISLYEMWLQGIMVAVILFIILDWIFVSMNATPMRFPVGMSKLNYFKIYSVEKKMYQ